MSSDNSYSQQETHQTNNQPMLQMPPDPPTESNNQSVYQQPPPPGPQYTHSTPQTTPPPPPPQQYTQSQQPPPPQQYTQSTSGQSSPHTSYQQPPQQFTQSGPQYNQPPGTQYTQPQQPPGPQYNQPPGPQSSPHTSYQQPPQQSQQFTQPSDQFQSHQGQINPQQGGQQSGFGQNYSQHYTQNPQSHESGQLMGNQQGTVYQPPQHTPPYQQMQGQQLPFQPQQTYENRFIDTKEVNLGQDETFPRPELLDADIAQPDVSGLFHRVTEGKVDMSKAQSKSRYIRTTIQCVPNTPGLLKKYGAPFGAVIHPFAHQPKDDKIPVVNMGSAGIVRCSECRTYINPYVVWLEKGRRWQCNMCRTVNNTSNAYYSPVNNHGCRTDLPKRKELTHGSVEFVATKYYHPKNPQPPSYVFVIDVSYNSVKSGAVKVIADTIGNTLDQLAGDIRTRIGFITYDSTIHFYNLKRTLKQPQMLVVGELEECLLPIPSDLLVNLYDSRVVVNQFLKKLPEMFTNTMNVESCLGSALNAAGRLLSHIGGKICTFVSTIPTMGPKNLSTRQNDDPSDSKVRAVTDGFKKLAILFNEDHICVDLFVLTSQFVDLAALSGLARYTGGSVKHYPAFSADIDGSALMYDISNLLTREQGFEAVMRIRVSSGFKISNFYGNFFIQGHDLLALPNVDSDKTFTIDLAYTDSFISTPNVSIQAAVLYTNSNGERRIRVHNLILPITQTLSEMYNHADVDCQLSLMAKIAVDDLSRDGVDKIRGRVEKIVVNNIQNYKKNVLTNPGAHNQLLLPARLSFLPLYLTSLVKGDAFTNISTPSDFRVAHQFDILNATVTQMRLAIHPIFISIHMIEKDEFEVSELRQLPLSQKIVKSNGVYVLCDGKRIMLYVGNSILQSNEEQMQDFHALVQRLNTFPLPEKKVILGETTLTKNACKVIRQLRMKFWFMPLYLVNRKASFAQQRDFVKSLIEDGEPTYSTILSMIYQQIGQ